MSNSVNIKYLKQPVVKIYKLANIYILKPSLKKQAIESAQFFDIPEQR
jgi:hypothetical protein